MASNNTRILEPWSGTGWPLNIFRDKNIAKERKGYLCSRLGCVGMLRDPWSLACGHRMCTACVEITRALLLEQRSCHPCVLEKQDELARAGGHVAREGRMNERMDTDESTMSTPAQRLSATSEDAPSAENSRIVLENANRDTAANREIGRFKVMCPFGCKAEPRKDFTIKLLEKHMSECENRQFPCEKCTETIRFSAREEHMRDICQFRPVECPNKCGKRGLQGMNLTKHLAECDKKPPMCLICKKPYPGLDFHQHLLECRPAGPCPMQCGQSVEGRIVDHLNEKKNFYLHSIKILELAKEIKQVAENANFAGVSQTQITGIQDHLLQLESRTETTQRQLRERVSLLTQEQAKDLLENARLAAKNRGDLKDLDGLFKVLAGDVHLLSSYDTTLRGLTEKSQKIEQETADRLSELDTQSNIRVADIEDQKTLLSNFRKTSFNGHLIWKIDRVQAHRNEAHIKHSIYSHPFYTEVYGYKMCARIYFNGDGNGKSSHISLFFVVMKGDYDALLPWPFQQKVTMKLKNQKKTRPDVVEKFRPEPSSSSFTRPKNEMNIASGCPQFVEQTLAFPPENGYVVDDTLFIEIVVDSSYEALHGLNVSVSEQGRGSAAGSFTNK